MSRSAALLASALIACGGGSGDGTTAPAETVASITLSAPKSALAVREQSSIAATFRDATGRTLIGVTGVVWSSSDAATVAVDQSGNIEALKLGGPVTITATKGAAAGTLTFSAVPVVRIDAAPTLGVDSSITASVVYVDHFDVTIGAPATVAWSSSNTNIVRVDATGRATGVAPGNAHVIAGILGVSHSQPIEIGFVSALDGEWTGSPFPVLSAVTSPPFFSGTFGTTRAVVLVVFGEIRSYSMPIVYATEFVHCTIPFAVGARTPFVNGAFALNGPYAATVRGTVTGADAIDVTIPAFFTPVTAVTCLQGGTPAYYMSDTYFNATAFVLTK